MPRRNDIEIEFDKETSSYYTVWEPVFISSGKTRKAALRDLKQAAHFGVDAFIDLKMEESNIRKEN